MILPFSTQLNGKPTYFVERIWEGLLHNNFQDDKEYIQFLDNHKERFSAYWDWFPDDKNRLAKPKIHTIREDKNDRWKVGTKIDFFINVRQKNMFRFAPVLPVVSTQEIEIEYTGSGVYNSWVFIDGKLMNEKDLLVLANNDGFDTVEDFFAYFNKDYVGKIIHWTDKQY